MANWLSDSELNRILAGGIHQIAHFAFLGYKSRGRGTVAITPRCEANRHGDATYWMRYLRYDSTRKQPGPQTCRIIASYDPYCEFVVQYPRPDGTIRTLHLPSPSVRLNRWWSAVYYRFKFWLQTALPVRI